MANTKRSPTLATSGSGENVRAQDRSNSSIDKPHDSVGQLIDKHGHLHSESVLKNWSPQMQRIMGIRRVEPKGEARESP